MANSTVRRTLHELNSYSTDAALYNKSGRKFKKKIIVSKNVNIYFLQSHKPNFLEQLFLQTCLYV